MKNQKQKLPKKETEKLYSFHEGQAAVKDSSNNSDTTTTCTTITTTTHYNKI